MAKWYDQYLTQSERKNLQVGQKGIRARNRKQQIENQTSLGNPKGLRDLNAQQTSLGNPKGLRDLEKNDTKKRLQDAFNKNSKKK